ncbi:SRPBCC family protein [Aureibaculum conchae]|uniref:SRPBCC family protein n=1 Tax=Aureibaculum sp. 2308TA14-22 TaxID=3108392 RepID=UPI00339153D1
MNLETNKVTVKKSQKEMFEFLSNVENFEQIMPENTDKFEAKEDSFLFALKGMPEIRLKIEETTPSEKIVLGSTSDKFPFTLTGNIISIDDDNSEVQLLFDGKFNPMMAMMIKNPIQKFISTLSENIEKL